ncbi:MAG TPA: HEAT repeat domain-containing protein [Candidatus Nitrosotenuis sp.]|nr:HEAT repeat domain-containing protein [Candidatus Nitrosotenuis sp.]
MTTFEQLKKVIGSGSKEEKIRAIESLSNSVEPQTISMLVAALDDGDIEVRGEAFSSLVLNEHDISHILIDALKSPSKNIRGYSALVLANRNDKNAVANIAELTNDESAMVRSCAVGALGYLRAAEALGAIRKCIEDPNVEVRKSAIKSAIDIGDKDLLSKLDKLSQVDDPEIKSLLVLAKNSL